jgi:hypothetical protein
MARKRFGAPSRAASTQEWRSRGTFLNPRAGPVRGAARGRPAPSSLHLTEPRTESLSPSPRRTETTCGFVIMRASGTSGRARAGKRRRPGSPSITPARCAVTSTLRRTRSSPRPAQPPQWSGSRRRTAHSRSPPQSGTPIRFCWALLRELWTCGLAACAWQWDRTSSRDKRRSPPISTRHATLGTIS